MPIFRKKKTIKYKVKKENEVKQYIKNIILVAIIICGLFTIFDLVNINKYINLTTEYDWLSFYGAIIGGLGGIIATLIGVNKTIQYQRGVEKENNKLKFMPLFQYEIDDIYDPSNCQSIHYIGNANPNTDGNVEWNVNLTVKNIGLGHAKGIESSIKIDNKIIDGTSISFPHTSIFFIGNTFTERYKFIKSEESLEGININNYNSYNYIHHIYITLYYNDLLNNSYEQTVYITIGRSIAYDEKNEKFDVHYWSHKSDVQDYKSIN